MTKYQKYSSNNAVKSKAEAVNDVVKHAFLKKKLKT